jgi:hypothetical protein
MAMLKRDRLRTPAALLANGLLLAVASVAVLPRSVIVCRAGSGHVAFESAFSACSGPASAAARCHGSGSPVMALPLASDAVAPAPCVDTALANPALAARGGYGAAKSAVATGIAAAPAIARAAGSAELGAPAHPLQPPPVLEALRTTVLTI